MLQVGDKLRRAIIGAIGNGGAGKPVIQKYTGRVVYIHPQRRYCVVEFDFPAGKIRECYEVAD